MRHEDEYLVRTEHEIPPPRKCDLVITQLAPAIRSTLSTPSPKERKKSFCNIAYTQGQVDWMRYMKEDCGWKHWDAMSPVFKRQFPDSKAVRKSRQCFSARYYRDNRRLPVLDENYVHLKDANGVLRYEPMGVRERGTNRGCARKYGLIDMYPERAVCYMWVRVDHKDRARRNLQLRAMGKSNFLTLKASADEPKLRPKHKRTGSDAKRPGIIAQCQKFPIVHHLRISLVSTPSTLQKLLISRRLDDVALRSGLEVSNSRAGVEVEGFIGRNPFVHVISFSIWPVCCV